MENARKNRKKGRKNAEFLSGMWKLPLKQRFERARGRTHWRCCNQPVKQNIASQAATHWAVAFCGRAETPGLRLPTKGLLPGDHYSIGVLRRRSRQQWIQRFIPKICVEECGDVVARRGHGFFGARGAGLHRIFCQPYPVGQSDVLGPAEVHREAWTFEVVPQAALTGIPLFPVCGQNKDGRLCRADQGLGYVAIEDDAGLETRLQLDSEERR